MEAENSCGLYYVDPLACRLYFADKIRGGFTMVIVSSSGRILLALFFLNPLVYSIYFWYANSFVLFIELVDSFEWWVITRGGTPLLGGGDTFFIGLVL